MKLRMKIIAILFVLFTIAGDAMAQVRVTIGSRPRPVYRHYVYRPAPRPYYGYRHGYYRVHHIDRGYHNGYYNHYGFPGRGHHYGHRH